MKKDRFRECLGHNIFALSVKNNLTLIYAPLIGLAFIVNESYKNFLSKAIKGDKKAQLKLELDDDTLFKLLANPIKKNTPSLLEKEFNPTNLTFFLTNFCSMSCRYCYIGKFERKTMSKFVAEKIIQKSIYSEKSNCFKLNFHGCDVGTCWSLFTHIVNFTKKLCDSIGLHLQTSIGSNGIYNQKQIEYIAHNISSATISLDGLPRVHNKYRILKNGKPSFQKVLQSLTHFDRLNFNYSIRMTVLDDTIDDLHESVSFICDNTKAKKIKIEPLFMRGNSEKHNLSAPEPYRFVDKFIEAEQIALKKKVKLTYSGARKGFVAPSFCGVTQPTLGVTADGYVTSCYEVLDKTDPLADYFIYGKYDFATDSLTLNDSVINRLKKAINNRKESCWDCFCRWNCGGDCPAKYLYPRSSTYEHLPDRCIITRELTRHQLLSSFVFKE